jgi:hypothetical protein
VLLEELLLRFRLESVLCNVVLVRCVSVSRCLAIASLNASVHFLGSVSLRLQRGCPVIEFICRWPWSNVHVIEKWSPANDNSWLTCQFLIRARSEAMMFVNVRSSMDCWPAFDCHVGVPGVFARLSPLLSIQVLWRVAFPLVVLS